MSDNNAIKKYVANVEEACGEEKDVIVMLKYEKRDEAIKKILNKAKVVKTLAGMAYDINFGDKSMRLYRTGKLLMKQMKDKKEAEEILKQLLG